MIANKRDVVHSNKKSHPFLFQCLSVLIRMAVQGIDKDGDYFRSYTDLEVQFYTYFFNYSNLSVFISFITFFPSHFFVI